MMRVLFSLILAIYVGKGLLKVHNIIKMEYDKTGSRTLLHEVGVAFDDHVVKVFFLFGFSSA